MIYLKKYAPTVYYTVDNSEGYDKIYFRLGGYLTDRKVNGINEIIGSYKVDGGKLTSTGDDLGKIGSKINNNDKLKKPRRINFLLGSHFILISYSLFAELHCSYIQH